MAGKTMDIVLDQLERILICRACERYVDSAREPKGRPGDQAKRSGDLNGRLSLFRRVEQVVKIDEAHDYAESARIRFVQSLYKFELGAEEANNSKRLVHSTIANPGERPVIQFYVDAAGAIVKRPRLTAEEQRGGMDIVSTPVSVPQLVYNFIVEALEAMQEWRPEDARVVVPLNAKFGVGLLPDMEAEK